MNVQDWESIGCEQRNRVKLHFLTRKKSTFGLPVYADLTASFQSVMVLVSMDSCKCLLFRSSTCLISCCLAALPYSTTYCNSQRWLSFAAKFHDLKMQYP